MGQQRSESRKTIVMREFFYHHNPCRTEQACWIWPKYIDPDGYGTIIFDGLYFKVHRLSFEHYKGKIPKGMVVMHSCDQRACFNPNHLFLGTHRENMQDMARKSRLEQKSLESELAPGSWAWRNPA